MNRTTVELLADVGASIAVIAAAPSMDDDATKWCKACLATPEKTEHIVTRGNWNKKTKTEITCNPARVYCFHVADQPEKLKRLEFWKLITGIDSGRPGVLAGGTFRAAANNSVNAPKHNTGQVNVGNGGGDGKAPRPTKIHNSKMVCYPVKAYAINADMVQLSQGIYTMTLNSDGIMSFADYNSMQAYGYDKDLSALLDRAQETNADGTAIVRGQWTYTALNYSVSYPAQTDEQTARDDMLIQAVKAHDVKILAKLSSAKITATPPVQSTFDQFKAMIKILTTPVIEPIKA